MDPSSNFINLCHFLICEFIKLINSRHLLDPSFIGRSGNGHYALLDRPFQQDIGLVCAQSLGDFLQDGDERAAFTRVSQHGGQGAVCLGDDIVLFVNVHHGLRVG